MAADMILVDMENIRDKATFSHTDARPEGARVRVPERPGSEPNNVAPPVAREEGVEGQRR